MSHAMCSHGTRSAGNGRNGLTSTKPAINVTESVTRSVNIDESTWPKRMPGWRVVMATRATSPSRAGRTLLSRKLIWRMR